MLIVNSSLTVILIYFGTYERQCWNSNLGAVLPREHIPKGRRVPHKSSFTPYKHVSKKMEIMNYLE